ncbi:MAG: hypothetical protein SPK03_06115, partial [Alloprevotella sp.]|nr:hypothetical protein [Alloprevotella sp.]
VIHKQTVLGIESERLPKKWMLKMSELKALLKVGSIIKFQWKVAFQLYLDVFIPLAPYLFAVHSVT